MTRNADAKQHDPTGQRLTACPARRGLVGYTVTNDCGVTPRAIDLPPKRHLSSIPYRSLTHHLRPLVAGSMIAKQLWGTLGIPGAFLAPPWSPLGRRKSPMQQTSYQQHKPTSNNHRPAINTYQRQQPTSNNNLRASQTDRQQQPTSHKNRPATKTYQ